MSSSSVSAMIYLVMFSSTDSVVSQSPKILEFPKKTEAISHFTKMLDKRLLSLLSTEDVPSPLAFINSVWNQSKKGLWGQNNRQVC